MRAESKLLLDEEPMVVQPSLAKLLGINQAIILQQMHYWLKINQKKGSPQIDGYYWTYNTYQEWANQFQWLSAESIKRFILDLENKGVVISRQFKRAEWDRTKSYTIDYDALENIRANDSCTIDRDKINPIDGAVLTPSIDLKPNTLSLTETTTQITTENTQREEPAAAAPPLPVFSTSPSIQAERTWQKVTNQATMPSTIRNDATEMILGLSMRYAWGEELCGYLTPYWEAWCNHKTKDGRPYSRTSAGWLEWAVAGQIPPESKKNGSGSKDPNNLPPVEEDPAERAKIDAIFANRSKNK